MDWKEFFKINKWKIIIIIIFIIAVFPSYMYYSSTSCEPGPCKGFTTAKIIFSLVSPGIYNLYIDNGYFMGKQALETIDIIPLGIFHIGVDIIYWYLMSCIIFLLIKKILSSFEKQKT